VKSSLAPGSKVVTEYLTGSGLLEDLEALGFYVVGYGCTTCIGNSGPLPEPISKAVNENGLVAVSVLSGNRNFEGRISPDVRANYLASPPLVVAYAIAGTVDWDPIAEPLGLDRDGNEVYLRDIWPTQDEIDRTVTSFVKQSQFVERYSDVFTGSEEWRAITTPESDLYQWDEASTYIQEPPFFQDFPKEPPPAQDITGARVLAVLGDSVTTDHISPAGAIPEDGPAGRYLKSKSVQKSDFNSFGSRRGNDRVMVRGTFGNIRLKNQMVPGVEGGETVHHPSGDRTSIFEASERYLKDGVPLVVLAGKEYGSGSSRDWAAKGTILLGVKAVLAESFERIHRSNLVGMGVLPLQFEGGQNAESLGLDGSEVLHVKGIAGGPKPRQKVTVEVEKAGKNGQSFEALVRLDTPVEVNYYRNGGILHTVLRKMLEG
jgi:aconitate hydratase